MRVIIPASDPECPAALALRTEGIAATVVVMKDDYHYARLLANEWLRGGFILLEHDVIAWFGAMTELWECEEPLCWHGYPNGNLGRLTFSLGCIKFADEFVSRFPALPQRWKDHHWSSLDGQVMEAVRTVFGRDEFHRHEPAFAHARDQRAAVRECLHTECWTANSETRRTRCLKN